MADLNLEVAPNYAGPEFEIVCEGLRLGYHENNQQAIERLLASWQADRMTRTAAWNVQQEAAAHADREVEEAWRVREEEEEIVATEEAEREQREAEQKKPKMNMFAPETSVMDILVHPASQYALHKLSTSNYVEMWYFSPTGCLDAAKYHDKSQANNTFSISRVDDLLSVHPIASIRASRNALPTTNSCSQNSSEPRTVSSSMPRRPIGR
ncbi:hypothetical protein PAXRUDRAFT_16015 [Paxillus rubicundulus Ve08.2h10]|uniref:Uncharacterized protein n=1 Tax=Paxillus rubicundulus Ve08.2h10 TaxID=930991 RepID=A0A0D0DN96_9AGAM|nr:hypothetical protein PAXRUDRAFT_16015 [Paxillus rubicundulus Ve08.2h10]